MKVAALCVLGALTIAVAAASVAVNLGWRPPTPVWDERTALATQLALFVELVILSAGIASLAPSPHLPRRLKTLPATATLLVPSFFVLAAVALHEGASPRMVASRLAMGVATGLTLSLVVAFMQSFAPATDDVAESAPRRRFWPALGVASATALLWTAAVLIPRAPDNGAFHRYLKLEHDGGTLSVGVKRTALFGTAYGVLRLSDAVGANALILEEQEWRSLMDQWNRARAPQTQTSARIGPVRDSVSDDPAVLLITPAPAGAQLQISSPRSPTVLFAVAAADYDALTNALAQAHADLR